MTDDLRHVNHTISTTTFVHDLDHLLRALINDGKKLDKSKKVRITMEKKRKVRREHTTWH